MDELRLSGDDRSFLVFICERLYPKAKGPAEGRTVLKGPKRPLSHYRRSLAKYSNS